MNPRRSPEGGVALGIDGTSCVAVLGELLAAWERQIASEAS